VNIWTEEIKEQHEWEKAVINQESSYVVEPYSHICKMCKLEASPHFNFSKIDKNRMMTSGGIFDDWDQPCAIRRNTMIMKDVLK